MSPLSEEEVRHVAHLARLSIDDADVPVLTRELDAILHFVGRLQQAELSTEAEALPPSSRRRREDVPVDSDVAAILDQAPLLEDGLFTLPAVLPAS